MRTKHVLALVLVFGIGIGLGLAGGTASRASGPEPSGSTSKPTDPPSSYRYQVLVNDAGLIVKADTWTGQAWGWDRSKVCWTPMTLTCP